MAEGNPYIGPRAFQAADHDRFFGRDGEVNQLVPLIYAHRLTVLFAQSGAGKTSLLNAGVLPVLEKEEGFDVLRSTRVSGASAFRGDEANVQNIYTFNAISGWLPPDETPDITATVAAYLAGRKRPVDAMGDPALRVAVFDQFEEVFTFYPDKWQARNDFFQQLRDALDADPLLRIVLSLREDYLANLDPHLAVFRGVSTGTFRIERLRAREALSAVVDPIKGTGRSYAKGVAEKLVADLVQVRVEREDGVVRVDGEYAEPVQLQVVCARLWDRLPQGTTEITEYGDIDEALTAFYEEGLEAAIGTHGVKEANLRDWFEHTLITSAGTRSSVYQGPEDTGGIPNPVVEILENAHVIRGETLRGSRWFELTHDRFVEPVRASNAAFRHHRRETRVRWAGVGVAAIVAVLIGIVAFALSRPEVLDAISITPGTTVENVAIDAGATVRYRFSFDADAGDPNLVDPQAVTVTLESMDLDSVTVRLFSVEDEQLAGQFGVAQAVRLPAAPERANQAGGAAQPKPQAAAATAQGVSTRLVRGLGGRGDYAIEVVADRPGTFTLGIAVGRDDRPPLEFGTSASDVGPSSVIEDGSAVDRWVIRDGVEGQLVQIDVDPAVFLDAVISLTQGANDDEIALVDASGPGDVETLVAELPADGEYIVEVSGFFGSTGVYRIGLRDVDPIDLSFGDEQVATIRDPGETRVYRFASEPGAVVEISLAATDAELDATISMSTLTGELVAFADSSGEGDPERLVAQLAGEGSEVRYLVTIAGYEESPGMFSTGGYSLRVDTPAVVAPVTLGDTVDGTIGAGNAAHVYTFSAAAGTPVSVQVDAASELAAEVAIGGATGSLVIGYAAAGFPSLVSTVIPIDGDYYVAVSGYAGSVGPYRLGVGRAEVKELPLDAEVAGDVASSGEVDYYEFSADAGTGMSIEITAADEAVVPYFTLYRRDTGELIDFSLVGDEPSRTMVDAEILATATYLVEVHFNGGAGAYTLSRRVVDPFTIDALGAEDGVLVDGPGLGDGGVAGEDVAAAAMPITVGEPVPAEVLAGGAPVYFVFSAPAGEAFDITVAPSGDLDPGFAVLGPDFEMLDGVDDFGGGDPETIVGFVAPTAGDYYIAVAEFTPGTASDPGFTLTITATAEG